METKKVYAAIADVTAKLAKEGISKDKKNVQQGYSFRGIDDVYNALAPFLAASKLCILPSVLEREVVERRSAKDTALFYVTVKVDFAFVSAEDGSDHHVVTYGEAMDSGDKATNKAMSAAYKYACMQAFCIPTEGDNDADKHTHEVKAPGIHKPTDGAKDSLTAQQLERIDVIAHTVSNWIRQGSIGDAVQELENADFEAEEKIFCWSLFDSKERSAMKREIERQKVAAAQKASEPLAAALAQ